MLNASNYKKQFTEPFDSVMVSERVAKAWGCDASLLRQIWKKNAEMSQGFGTALHSAMEQFWRYKDVPFNGNSPFLSKNKTLLGFVELFPEKERSVLPEIFVSDTKRGWVGQVDGLYVLDQEKKTAKIMDYKTDAELDAFVIEKELTLAKEQGDKNEISSLRKKLKKAKDTLRVHFIQLSFYAYILRAFGWTIEGLEIWNFTDSWKCFEGEVLNLEELEANNK